MIGQVRPNIKSTALTWHELRIMKVHYADAFRPRNMTTHAKLVFRFGLAKDNVCGDILL